MYTKSFLPLVLLFSLVFLASCSEEKEKIKMDVDAPLYTLLPSEKTNITFQNTSIETPNRHLGFYDYFYNGSGVAIGDLNNDGLQDIFFAGNDTANKLYINEGDLTFKDISDQAQIDSGRWATGVTMIDINDDGFLDIYVCNSGPYLDDSVLRNQLFINNGDLTFTESAKAYGIDDASYSSQATFFDMDKDGDLDLFVMNHSLLNYGRSVQEWENALINKPQDVYKRSCSTLYRNDGQGKFTDITEAAGLFRPGFGLGVAISDFDENGFLDIYVANDYFVPDYLFFNSGNGTFTESIKSKFSHTSFYSMGCDAADFNNDGLIDLAVVDMTPSDHYRSKTLMESMDVKRFDYLVEDRNFLPQYMFNTLNLNRGAGNFSEIAHMSGVAQTDWSWAALFADLDNDMHKDLVVTNGFKRDTKDRDWGRAVDARMEKEGRSPEIYYEELQKAKSIPITNYVYKNNGSLNFEDKSKEWGFEDPSFSNGAAYGDLDNDGDLDLVVNNLERTAFVYRNNTSEKGITNFVQFELKAGANFNKALNSRIKLVAGGQEQLVEYSFVRGYLSGMQPLAHFGIGNSDKIDKVEITWPDGKITSIDNPQINKKHKIDRFNTSSTLVSNKPNKGLFYDITSQASELTYTHRENEYDDFAKEILLPHKQSTLGPALAVADVNGDGIQDFFVGGAKGQSGALYTQIGTRGLVPIDTNVFQQDAAFEDLGALFFDADGDGDMDLYVASGGGGDVMEVRMLQDRLYLNAGDGSFARSNRALPRITSSTASIAANDWDGDGDLDLFVGGRTTPGKYPLPPDSYLLENQNGIFKDVTATFGKELQKAGMITASCWSDLDGDGKQELIVVGEWTPVMVYSYTGNQFINSTESYGLSEDTGWWYSVEQGDFDNDGDMDLIAGNLGLNNKFHPNKDKPLHVFSHDFDDNGTLDIVLSKTYKGNLAPVRGKECSTEQMPFISEKFPMYSEFATSTLEDIYGAENLAAALHYQATTFASVYLENLGDGTFKSHRLPSEAQLAPIQDIVVWDFNKDGNLDIVIAGNMYNTEVETPSYDAGKGLFLQGNGDGSFTPIDKIAKSGLFMPKDVQDLSLLMLSGSDRPAILTANNNDALQLFVWTQ